MILQRIGVLSCAKVLGAVYTGVGLIVGFFVSMFGVLQSMFLGASDFAGGAAAFGFLFGIGGIVILPIAYGVMGFIAGPWAHSSTTWCPDSWVGWSWCCRKNRPAPPATPIRRLPRRPRREPPGFPDRDFNATHWSLGIFRI
jgi:hypothetical protein